MSRSVPERVRDIVDAADSCALMRPYLESASGDFRAMAEDATLHQIMIIGEAIRGLPDAMLPNPSVASWRAARDARNIIVHEYFRVDRGIIREIVDNEIADLALSVLGAAWSSAHDTGGYPDPIAAIERWMWKPTWAYMEWLEESLGPRVVARERERLMLTLENDLEEIVLSPWPAIYETDGPEYFREPDSDYHYYNQAPLDLGWSNRYDSLWSRYLALWHAYNREMRQ